MLHRRHALFRQPWRQLRQLPEVLRLSVEKEVGPAGPVAPRVHQHFRLVPAHGGDDDLVVRKALFQLLLERGSLLVEEVVAKAVRCEARSGDHLSLPGAEERTHVDIRVFEEQLLVLDSLRVEDEDRRLVPPEVRRDVEFFVVEREEERRHAFSEVRGQDVPEGLVLLVAVEKRRVHSVGAHRDPQLSIVVRHPPRDIPRVLLQQRQISRRQVQPIDVEEALVPSVHADQEKVVLLLKAVDDGHAGILERRQLARLGPVGRDGVEPVVLIAAPVLKVDDPVVPRPEVGRDIPLRRADHRKPARTLYEFRRPCPRGKKRGHSNIDLFAQRTQIPDLFRTGPRSGG